MGLTFPWEPRCLDFHCCYFQCWRLGGAGVLQSSCLTSAISLQPQSYLDPCILNENAKALQSVLHMEPKLQAACLRAAVYLYNWLPPRFWYESSDTTISILIFVSPITQVLHLMNKMNLPCPFGPVTARPPMVSLLLSGWVVEYHM